jgi:hypothetical protein
MSGSTYAIQDRLLLSGQGGVERLKGGQDRLIGLKLC